MLSRVDAKHGAVSTKRDSMVVAQDDSLMNGIHLGVLPHRNSSPPYHATTTANTPSSNLKGVTPFSNANRFNGNDVIQLGFSGNDVQPRGGGGMFSWSKTSFSGGKQSLRRQVLHEVHQYVHPQPRQADGKLEGAGTPRSKSPRHKLKDNSYDRDRFNFSKSDFTETKSSSSSQSLNRFQNSPTNFSRHAGNYDNFRTNGDKSRSEESGFSFNALPRDAFRIPHSATGQDEAFSSPDVGESLATNKGDRLRVSSSKSDKRIDKTMENERGTNRPKSERSARLVQNRKTTTRFLSGSADSGLGNADLHGVNTKSMTSSTRKGNDHSKSDTRVQRTMTSVSSWISSTERGTIQEEQLNQSSGVDGVASDDDSFHADNDDDDNDSVFSSGHDQASPRNGISSPLAWTCNKFTSMKSQTHISHETHEYPYTSPYWNKPNDAIEPGSLNDVFEDAHDSRYSRKTNQHHNGVGENKLYKSDPANTKIPQDANTNDHQQSITRSDSNEEADPEYLDSYSEVRGQNMRRMSLWDKLRGIGPISLRFRSISPADTTLTPSMSRVRTVTPSVSSSDKGSSSINGDRCPNCYELLQKAPPRLVVVNGNEKSFLTWILSKWSGRRDLQKYGASNQRGYLPHYCNFVRSKAIHDRVHSVTSKTSLPDDVTIDDDDEDDGYITNTELSNSESYRQNAKKGGKDKTTSTSNTLTNKDATDNAILRAASPGSTSYDPESLFDRLREEGLAGSTSALNDSQLDDDAPPSPHVNFDLSIEVRSDGLTRDVNTQTSTTARGPIQIPSTDDVNKDNDGKGKDITDIFKELTSPLTPLKSPASASVPKAKRTPCAKKSKMPGKERKKKGKKKEEKEEVQDGANTEETQISKQPDEIVPTEEAVQVKVDVNVPDLPDIDTGRKDKGKAKRRKGSKKTLISPSAPTDKGTKNQAPPPEEPKRGFYDFTGLIDTTTMAEDTTLSKPQIKVPSYLSDRMVLSLQSSRFELPMDMKSLEKMSPEQYLKKHCIVSTRRKTLYNKMFQKYKEKSNVVLGKNVNNCLKDVLVNTINSDQVVELRRLLDIEDDTEIDFQFFCGMAALGERILYPYFVTEDTADRTEYHREKVECADFCALDWKLDGVNVSKQFRQLLESIS